MVSVDLQVSSAASFILSSLIAQRLSNLGRRATDSCTTYTSCTINISPLIRGKVSAGTCLGPGGPKEIPLTSVAMDFSRLPSTDLAPSRLRKIVHPIAEHL